VQKGAASDEALTEDIDHSDAEEQPPPVALAALRCNGDLVETVNLREDITLRNISCSQIWVNQRAIRRCRIVKKNMNGSR